MQVDDIIMEARSNIYLVAELNTYLARAEIRLMSRNAVQEINRKCVFSNRSAGQKKRFSKFNNLTRR
jgi:hypothetical protein